MIIAVEKKIQRNIKDISHQMGIREKELINRALLLYLESAKKIFDVAREFNAWDSLSDEALSGLVKRSRLGL